MYQSHHFSSALLLCLATIMATLLVPPASAADIKHVYVFNNKDEALKKCNSIQGDKNDNIVVYPGPQDDKDIFYFCGPKREETSGFRAGAKCEFEEAEAITPDQNVDYLCKNGHWQFIGYSADVTTMV